MKIRDELKRLFEDVNKEIENDFFKTPIIIFDNLALEQWFKVNWLRNNKDKIYMNIKCARFNDLYKMLFNKKALDKKLIQKYLLNYFKDKTQNKDYDYFFDGQVINQARLYDYTKKLASILMDYENYDFTPVDYQKDIYDKVKEKEIYSLKELADGEMNKLSSKIFIFVTRELLPLEKKIIDNYNNKYNGGIEVYNAFDYSYEVQDINLKSAPSKLREIEILHSEICKLIKDDKAKLSDIVVYAPSIDEYQAEIARVFKQTDEGYPNVPYVLSSPKRNDILDGITTVFKIIKNGYATRLDFINLVSNKEIMKEWYLDDKALDTIISTIIDTNTYRNSDLYGNDFEKLKTRVLLSNLVGTEASVDNITKLSEENVPFDSISLDDSLKSKLIDLIDLVLQLFEIKMNDTLQDKFEKVSEILNNLFNKTKNSKIFKNISKELYSFIDFKFNETDKLSVETLFYFLLDSASFNISNGLPFSSGVSFLNMSDKNVVSAKYTFIIGMSSKNYPRVEIDTELNQNKNKETVTDIDKKTITNVVNNSDNLFVSYVNVDLKKDEDFYPSIVLKDYNYEEKRISLDEKERDYEELYTKREKKNKDYYKNLVENKTVLKPVISSDFKAQEVSCKEKLRTLKDYLNEPLKTKAEKLFGIYNDETIDNVNKELEPLELNNLDSSIIKEQILASIYDSNKSDEEKKLNEIKNVLPRFEYSKSEYDEYEETIKGLDEVNDPNYKLYKLSDVNLFYSHDSLFNDEKCFVETLIKRYVINNNLDKNTGDYKEEVKALTEQLNGLDVNGRSAQQNANKELAKRIKHLLCLYEYYFSISNLKFGNHSKEIINWTIDCKNKSFLKKETPDIICYSSLKSLEELYLVSLIDMLNFDIKDDVEIEISITCKIDTDKKECKVFSITKNEARYILNRIHYELNDYSNNIILDIDAKDVDSKFDLLEIKNDEHGSWANYSDKGLFGIDDLFNVVENGQILEAKPSIVEEKYLNEVLKYKTLKSKISD